MKQPFPPGYRHFGKRRRGLIVVPALRWRNLGISR